MTSSTAPRVGNDLFIHNMRALWRTDPTLAIVVDAVDDSQRFELEPTRNGMWTAKMPTLGQNATYLHSRYDPEVEARRFVDSQSRDEKFCFVVSGIGLGYHIRALGECIVDEALIVCIEPSIRLIATALTCCDLSELIASKRLIIFTSNDKARVHERLQPHSALIMLGAQFLTHEPSTRGGLDSYTPILETISDFVSYTKMSIMTLVSNARVTCQNIAMNFVHYVSTPPIDILRDRFAGNPAVVISAGPSLSKNIDQLAALKGYAVLCAVQTTLKPLTARGITPDFVTTLDFHEMSRKFFNDVGNVGRCHLVAEPKATWHVLDDYTGPVSLLDNSWARLVLGEELGGRGGLQAGATVSHLAFYLAAYMGCDPIIFVGQDLAFTGHVFYVPGVEIHQAWRGEINRFNSMEQKEWDRIMRNRSILRKVPGIDGDELYSDELLTTYLEQFEKDIAAVPARVINATQGGARIQGAQPMPLAEAVERFCKKPIEAQRFEYSSAFESTDRTKLDRAGHEVQQRLDELEGVTNVCNELLELLKELETLLDDPQRFNRRLIRVDELRTKIHQGSRAYMIVNAATQLAELRRYSADRRIGAKEGADDTERAKSQIARDIEFISGVRDGAGEVKPILQAALKRLRLGPGKL